MNYRFQQIKFVSGSLTGLPRYCFTIFFSFLCSLSFSVQVGKSLYFNNFSAFLSRGSLVPSKIKLVDDFIYLKFGKELI